MNAYIIENVLLYSIWCILASLWPCIGHIWKINVFLMEILNNKKIIIKINM